MASRHAGSREPAAGALEALLAAEHEAGHRLELARAEAAGLVEAARASARECLEATDARLQAGTAEIDAAMAARHAAAVHEAEGRHRATRALEAYWDDDRCEALAAEVIEAVLAEVLA